MDYETLILIFTAIIYEALPFVVLGVLLAGILEEFVPQQALVKVIPSNTLLAVMLGGVLGLVFPMCECGIVVVMRRLLRKGLPLGVCVSYMLAGPIINVVVMLSTYAAFNVAPQDAILGGGLNVVLLRVGLAFIIAVNTGLLVERMQRKAGLPNLLAPVVLKGLGGAEEEQAKGPRTWAMRLNNISATALNDFVDIMAFLIIGAAAAGAGRLMLQQANLTETIQGSPAIAILCMMGIAVLFCLCSEADAFVAANFATYWPPASKLAFLVLGPMMDIKLYIMYTRVFRPKLIAAIITSVVVQVFVLTMLVNTFEPQIKQVNLEFWKRTERLPARAVEQVK